MNGKNTHGMGVRNARSFRWSYQTIVARLPVQAIDGWNWCPGPEWLSIGSDRPTAVAVQLAVHDTRELDRVGRRVRLLDALREDHPQDPSVPTQADGYPLRSRHPHVLADPAFGSVSDRTRVEIGAGQVCRVDGSSCGTPRLIISDTLLNVLPPLVDVAIRMRSAVPLLAELAPDDVEVAVEWIDDDDRRLIQRHAGRELGAVRPRGSAVVRALHPDVAVRIVAAAEERRVGHVDHAGLDRLGGRRTPFGPAGMVHVASPRGMSAMIHGLSRKRPLVPESTIGRAQIARRLVGIRRIVVVDEHRSELHARLPFAAGVPGLNRCRWLPPPG